MKFIGMLYLGKKGAPTVDTLEMCKSLVCNNKLCIILSKQIENLNEYLNFQKAYPDKVQIFAINTYNNKIDFLLKSLNIFKFLFISIKIKKQKLDFIYLPMITYWGAILSFFMKSQNLVTAVHDPESHIGEENKLFELLTKKCINHSNYLVVFSKKFIKTVSEKYSFPDEKICNLRLGGYSYYKQNGDTKNNGNIKFNKILFFGRLSEYKGLDLLLEAIKAMKTQGAEISLRVVGSGSLSKKEQKLIGELGSTVELVNRWIKDDEVENFFNGVDFTVLPYIEASQSGIIMLSYAMHKAVLATNVGALAEQVTDETGMIIEPNNVEALMKGIKEMYKNGCFYSKGQKAFYYATEEWTWKKQAQKLLEFIE